MATPWIIGVDIGGTKISSGLLTANGQLKYVVTVPTMADKSKYVVINQIITTIEQLIADNSISIESIKGIGVCAPGPLNPITGEIINPPNLPSMWNTNLKEVINSFYNLPVVIENDANAAGLAETKIGIAQGYDNVIYTTISTGIGTGIIINGKIYHGKNGFAGEGGHLSTNYKGTIYCNCKAPSCIEGIASGSAIARKAKELISSGKAENSLLASFKDQLDTISAKDVGDLALQNDPLAMEIIKESAFNIGAWLGGLINLLDPEVIVLGGGVTSIGELFFSTVRETVLKFSYNIFADKIPILPAKLKTNVGIYGAASLFIE